MADVAKTPVKRKSLGGKQDSAKKQKINPVKTPKGGPQKPQNATPKPQNATPKPRNATPKPQLTSPKSQRNPKGQNGVQKTPKTEQKQKNNESQKKVKPFEGTKQIESPKQKKIKTEPKEKKEKKRRSIFFNYRQILNSGDEEAKSKLAITLGNKIKTIESRPDELTKSAKRKLKKLKNLQKHAQGIKTEVPSAANAVSKASNKKNSSAVAANIKVKVEKQEKTTPQKAKQNQKGPVKKPKIEIEEDEDSDEESDGDMDEEVEDESDEESDDEGMEEQEDDDDDDDEEDAEDEEDEDDDDSDEESEEDHLPPKQEKPRKTKKSVEQSKQTEPNPSFNPINMEDLEKNKIVGKNQQRYVLFVGNIPYDTQKEDLKQHFEKCGQIKHIRIPTDKNSSKPRGFAYVELENADTYQRCLSMHHTFMKGRRINVLYSMGGKKKGEEQKKEMKAKNFKLHAMRKQGQLAGSKKESQKRSFRRKKQKQPSSEVKSE